MGPIKRFLATWGNGDFGRQIPVMHGDVVSSRDNEQDELLGHGSNAAELIPRVVSSLKDEGIHAVACGSAHTLAVGGDGSVYSSGLNTAGQLGHSNRQDSSLEMKEMLLPEAATAVAAGSEHSLVLTESGDVWAVGNNKSGQLGLGTSAASSSGMPHRISALAGAKISSIAACMDCSLAVMSSGEVLSWGSGGSGQLGHGSQAIPQDRNEPAPRLISSLKGHTIVQASAGFVHAGAVEEDGSLWMWGGNPYWQLGGSKNPQASEPIKIDLRSCQQLALHGHHSMALLRSGAVTVWGPNENGLLGLGSKGPNASRSPTIIPDITFSQVACGWRHCGGITCGGRLYMWGWGGAEGTSSMLSVQHSSGGQLGLGNEFDYWKPTKVERLQDHDETAIGSSMEGLAQWTASQVSCGLNHSAAIVEIHERPV